MRLIDMPEFRDKKHVLTFEASKPLYAAISQMAEKNYGACLVTENDKLVGIFTERDLLRRVAPHSLDMQKATLSDVMSTDLKTAKKDDLVADCLRRMSHGRFRHLPVVDDEGKAIGMLSQGDFVAFTMSDIVGRMSTAAKASVTSGYSTPWSMIAAIIVYTLGLLFIVSAIGFWGPGGEAPWN